MRDKTKRQMTYPEADAAWAFLPVRPVSGGVTFGHVNAMVRAMNANVLLNLVKLLSQIISFPVVTLRYTTFLALTFRYPLLTAAFRITVSSTSTYEDRFFAIPIFSRTWTSSSSSKTHKSGCAVNIT
jgi:hypothetical protein